MIQEADASPTVENLVQAATAARLMRDYEAADEYLDATWNALAADEYLDATWNALGPVVNNLITNSLWLAAASGDGVSGVQRTFRELSEAFYFSPIQISNWAGNFPEILASGEYDEMALRFSPDSDDPAYRCACLNTVAWVHRLAGRHDEAAAVWASAVGPERAANIDAIEDMDAQAAQRGQYARDLARAGMPDEARRQLEQSMATPVSAGGLPNAQRRWAQAYAELGDAEGAVAQLEPLLTANSLITVHTLESRAAWMLVRDDPAFQQLLARHR
jgi:tetratricopeptide (TPR) repeat protein